MVLDDALDEKEVMDEDCAAEADGDVDPVLFFGVEMLGGDGLVGLVWEGVGSTNILISLSGVLGGSSVTVEDKAHGNVVAADGRC